MKLGSRSFMTFLLLVVAQAGFGNGGGFFFGRVSGVSGVDAFDDVRILLTGPGVLETTAPDSQGQFAFYGIEDGDYVIQVRKPGFKAVPARPLRIEHGALVSATESEFVLEELGSDTFVFHWEEDQNTAGYEYQAHIAEPLEVEILDEDVPRHDGSSANQLLRDYNIKLLDGAGVPWTHEHAYRLLRTMQMIPQRKRDAYREQSLPESRWLIARTHVRDDIRISSDGEGPRTIWIAENAFVNARPKLARVEGKRGLYYSQRLHHALVRFVTDNGRDEDAYERILQERYGLTTRIERHTTYEALTASTTREPASRFQAFHSEEIIQLINTLEEMPVGMHAVPGLRFVVRRLDGTPNPWNPSAPAIAWTDAGYIEFMDKAFDAESVLHTHRLIIHEKAHFLWAHLFDGQLKQDWIELGGWYRDATTASGWATTKQTEFVSAYAHKVDPNEDMAESIAYFIVNPRKLRSRSIGKYEFVRDRIMQGDIYISKIREDLTFEVYNLFPDYVFPGKIRRVDIVVEGAAEESKHVRVEIELHATDHVLEGAKSAFTRIFSDTGSYKDLHLYPVGVPRGAPGTVLAGSFELSRFARAGYWRPQQIRITDEHGNQRLGGVNDFGWMLHIDNPWEDVIRPRYVSNSAALAKSTEIMEGREVQIIHATWSVDENSGLMRKDWACYVSLNDENPDTYRIGEYGHYDPEKRICIVDVAMPHYMPSSVYTMSYVKMTDRALNQAGVYFRSPGWGLRGEDSVVDEPGQQIELITNNGDTEPPELDLNNIQIAGKPTNPAAPNGETVVVLEFRARDDISGFRIAGLRLRDPQGITHHFWVQHSSTHSLFSVGDPSQWTTYTWSVTLPAGSAPGIWGLQEMKVEDRAGNFKTYDFTEILHFELR